MPTPDTQKLLLKSVNILLRSIGELAIQDEADIDALVEAREAADTIQEVTDAVMSEGWDFNTDEGYTLPLAPDGTIPIPFNMLDISSTDGDLIMREWLLFSRSQGTHTFTEPKKVDITWNISFNNLTHPIRHYITIRAALLFNARMIGDSAAFKYTSKDEITAFYAAKHSESRTGKYNMLNGGFGSEVNSRGL